MPEAIEYHPAEIVFIHKNFFKLSKEDLLDGVNAMRERKIKMSSLRHQCYRMGLKKGIQIRWSDDDIQFLRNNFQKIGDVELAERLTKRKKTYRIINGKRVYRRFTKKHVEKKRNLLNLKRSSQELKNIRLRNEKNGRMKTFSSDDNMWTRQIKIPAKEHEIRIWNTNGQRKKYIKINGRFIPYARWYYHNFIAELTPDKKVYHLDLDTLNDDPDNLRPMPFQGLGYSNYVLALKKIDDRIQNHLKNFTPTTSAEEKKWQSKLWHLRNVKRRITSRLNKFNQNKHSAHFKKSSNKIA
jgi:hypothetical protein